MTLHDFILVAHGLDTRDPAFEVRLIEAGCDDATIAVQNGRILLDFTREAPSLSAALDSALATVRQAGATIDRIEPDPLVTLADIAARAGLTRQAITQFAHGQRGGGGFPAPVARVASHRPLWRWRDVADWLHRSGRLDHAAVERARILDAANLALAARADDPVPTILPGAAE
jgi:hypothetical protein